VRLAGGVTLLALAGSVVVTLAATSAGLQRALPFEPEIDEATFVQPAIRIAATGNLDPGWFGHPGATVIYPLALLFRLTSAGDVQTAFGALPERFYLLGRWLSVGYEVLAIPLVFLLGRAVFGTFAGLAGAWLTALLPTATAHAQIVRTDSAAMCFGLLALWLGMRASGRQSRWYVALAGVSVGFAIATRWFMVALVPVALWSAGRRWWMAALATALAFVVASPFAVLDLPALRASLLAEAEPGHVGADGLSPVGNVLWYLRDSLPSDLTWLVALLAAVGVGLSVGRRNRLAMVLVAYVALFLVLISASTLHWHRWTIQVLPVLMLFAGFALQSLPRRLGVLGVAVASIQLGAQLLVFDLQQLQPSPRVLAREWLVGHATPGASVVSEWYGPPLDGSGLAPRVRFSLADQPLDSYRGYLVVSSAVYDRYFAEPERYASQVRFYEELFARGRLLAEFRAQGPKALVGLGGAECNCWLHPTRGAPSLRIYALGSTDGRSGAASAMRSGVGRVSPSPRRQASVMMPRPTRNQATGTRLPHAAARLAATSGASPPASTDPNWKPSEAPV
jgi:hypothetical protein